MRNDFSSGQVVELSDLLAHRDRKQAIQQDLFKKFPEVTLVMLSINIPGPIKNNDFIQEIFDMGQKELIIALERKQYVCITHHIVNEASGLESYQCFKQSPMELKRLAVEIEESHPLGRYFDIDVLYQDKNKHLHLVSRKELFFPSRQCLICDKTAKLCARQRTHTLDELYKQIIYDYERVKRIKK